MLFGKSKKIQELEDRITQLQETQNPTVVELEQYESKLLKIKKEFEETKIIFKKLDEDKCALEEKITILNSEINEKENEIKLLNNELDFLDIGLYIPLFEFTTSQKYKEKLSEIREEEKSMIKDKTATSYPTSLTYNGSLKQGQSIINNTVKQILRSFNNECDVIIDKANFNNITSLQARIEKSYNSLNKLNNKLNVEISHSYLSLKLKELDLAYQYAVKKNIEKERKKEERERLREEAKLKKEIEEARKKLEKEKAFYQKALEDLNSKIENNPNDNDLLEKRKTLSNQMEEINKGLSDIDYREANKRAGYVYIISNIGSFGEGIYKIGMTRRLDPMERINELGDASVPFNFDVHAIIFSDDAPSLENSLHKAFENQKVNMINQRREFFRTTIDEIEKVVKNNYEKTVEFTYKPNAEQYWETVKILKNLK